MGLYEESRGLVVVGKAQDPCIKIPVVIRSARFTKCLFPRQ